MSMPSSSSSAVLSDETRVSCDHFQPKPKCRLTKAPTGWYDGGAAPVSYTWVDVTIERPPGRNVLGSWSVRTNDTGQQFKTHKRRFDFQSTKFRRLWPDPRAGDVIQMIPRANYPGWACLVREAYIKIGYEPSPEDKSTSPTSGFMSNAMKYPSRLLDSKDRAVRLLVVQPAPATSDPINCSLVTTVLPAEQPFDALSYCWGAGKSKTLLTVDGQDVLVSSSVVAALRQLRPEKQELAIWIDQVCINQDDMPERDKQVRLMADIYSSAATVHVWLGEGDIATWTALRIIRDAFNMNHRVCPGGATGCKCHQDSHGYTAHALEAETFLEHCQRTARGRDEPSFKYMTEVCRAHVKNEPGELVEAAGTFNNLQLTTLMSTLFVNPWFRRVWVLQEALLAPDAIVHCGQEVVPWAEVLQMSDWLATIHQPLYWAPHITMPYIWGFLRRHKGGAGGQAPELELLDVFMHGLEMRATDPRDKLFALLSFAKGTVKGTNVPLPIQSTYEKPREQVFADFTLWWIRENKSLSILSRVHGHKDRTWQRLRCDPVKPRLEAPTWAIPHEGQAKWARITLDSQFDFAASVGTVPDQALLDQALSDPNDLRLRLGGFEMTRIKEIRHLSLKRGYSEPLITPARKLLHVLDALFDPCGRHLTWNSKFKGHDWVRPASLGPEGLLRDVRDHANTHGEWERNMPSHPALHIPRHLSAPDSLAADRQLEEAEEDDDAAPTATPTCLDPFLFEGENGSVGLCPWLAEKGDVVVFLHGGKVPYLLRPLSSIASSTTSQSGESVGPGSQGSQQQIEESTTFQFIGECYVMGAMYGQWFRSQLEKDRPRQIFTIV